MSPSIFGVQIVEVGEAEALEAEVALYGSDSEENQYLNMQHVDTSVSLTFGGARVVFLNKFVSDVLVNNGLYLKYLEIWEMHCYSLMLK